jgi:hypothetical protein
MKFKSFLAEVTYKYKKDKGSVKIDEYKEFCTTSTMPKKDVKNVVHVIHSMSGELPVLHENKTFYMVDVKTGHTRPVKTRHDKEAVGVILNGLYLKESNEESRKALRETSWGWDMPQEVYKENR